MHSVGISLREARERKGFSLEDINARTRINAKSLAAIEHDDVSEISSPFIYRSFVRQYADQVGLDFEDLSENVEALAGHMRQPELPGQTHHHPIHVPPIQPRPKRDFSWIKPAIIFLVVFAIGSGGYSALKYLGPLLHEAAFASPAAVKEAVTPQPASTVPAEPVSAAVPSKQSTERIHLEVAATERTWLSVSADGKPAYTGILQPAQTKILDGQEVAKLRTGNAGGVNIIFNGKDIGIIGPRGKSRTVVFTKAGYEVRSDTSIMRANHIGG